MDKDYYIFDISEINMEGQCLAEDDYNDYIFCPVSKGICYLDYLENKVRIEVPKYPVEPLFNLCIEGEDIRQTYISGGAFSGYFLRNMITFIHRNPNHFKKISEYEVNKYLLAEKLCR
jgi:hypothetical protein